MFIILFLILLIITCYKIEYFNTNKETDIDYRSENIFGTGKYRNYDVQGFSIGKNSVYISAYHIFHHKSGKCPKNCSDGTSCPSNGICSDGKKCLDQGEKCPKSGICSTGDKCTSDSLSRQHSKIFKINKKTKKIEKVYNLTDQEIKSHVSALHVVENSSGNPIQIIIGYKDDEDNRGLAFYNNIPSSTNEEVLLGIKTDIFSHTSKEKIDSKSLDDDCLGKALAPTYIAIDKTNKKFWYGNFLENKVGAHICSRDLIINTDGTYSLEKQNSQNEKDKFSIDHIKNAQGMAIKDGIFYIGSSYGCDIPRCEASKIYTVDPKTKETKPYAKGWCGLQEIEFDEDGKLWGTTEAGSLYYQKTGWPSHPGWIYSDIQKNLTCQEFCKTNPIENCYQTCALNKCNFF